MSPRKLSLLLLSPAPLPVWIALGFLVLGMLGSLGWRPAPPQPRLLKIAASQPPPPKPAPVADSEPPAPANPYPKPSKLGPVTRLKGRALHEWTTYDAGNPRSYQVGAVKLTFSSDGDTPEELAKDEGLRVTLRAPGVKSDVLQSPDAYPRAAFRVGRMDPRRPEPQVLIVAHSVGAHCCHNLILASPHRGAWRFERLIALDGDLPEDWLTDRDGDGFPEIVATDDAFLYRFCPYVCSLPPPIVYQVENGGVVDVSNRRAFRKIFETALPELTARCKEHENSACASMVAVASRLGRRKQAWKIMLASYDPKDNWPLPRWCRIDPGEAECPKDKLETYERFPDALFTFLKREGYGNRSGSAKIDPDRGGRPW